MAKQHPEVSPESIRHGHETDENIRIRGFVYFVVVFVSVAIVIHVILYFLFGALVPTRSPSPVSELAIKDPIPPPPQIQGSAIHKNLDRQDLQELRHREDMVLYNYGWADRQANTAHVPIDRAMQMLLARGLPTTRSTAK